MPIKKYKTKQVEVEAIRFDDEDVLMTENVTKFLEHSDYEMEFSSSTKKLLSVRVLTFLGMRAAKPGDFIIKNTNGGFFPLTSQEFKEQFEAV